MEYILIYSDKCNFSNQLKQYNIFNKLNKITVNNKNDLKNIPHYIKEVPVLIIKNEIKKEINILKKNNLFEWIKLNSSSDNNVTDNNSNNNNDTNMLEFNMLNNNFSNNFSYLGNDNNNSVDYAENFYSNYNDNNDNNNSNSNNNININNNDNNNSNNINNNKKKSLDNDLDNLLAQREKEFKSIERI